MPVHLCFIYMTKKHWFSAVTLSVILVVHPILPYIEYFTFKKYISENFCINRDKPKMCCNGKCYLEKRLKENNQEEQNQKGIPSMVKVDILLYHSQKKDKPQVSPVRIKKIRITHKNFYDFMFTSFIFRPPQNLV